MGPTRAHRSLRYRTEGAAPAITGPSLCTLPRRQHVLAASFCMEDPQSLCSFQSAVPAKTRSRGRGKFAQARRPSATPFAQGPHRSPRGDLGGSGHRVHGQPERRCARVSRAMERVSSAEPRPDGPSDFSDRALRCEASSDGSQSFELGSPCSTGPQRLASPKREARDQSGKDESLRLNAN